MRGPVPLRPDTRVHYAGDVAPRKIDRGEWARQVARLVDQETAGNKSRFGTRVGVTYKTVNRWLNSEVDVSEEKVREVARAFHIHPADLLVRVGYYAAADFTTPPPASTDDNDPARKRILATDLPPHMKRRMLERLENLRAAQREREAEDVQWWIDQAREA